ncbi:MAG: SMP-30/gluconolactonase/LRE family protein [Hellea sp.]|nr:SMP-30/gluconolactonase/LRE family protein [Hellea sp.]
MKRALKITGISLALLLAYLFFWPVPIDPVSWEAPEDKGYVGDFAPNNELAGLELLDIGDIHGPEDVASRVIDGQLYLFVSSQDGLIRQINADTFEVTTLADTGGVPLGLEFDTDNNLIVADAYRGLLSIAPNGKVATLTNAIGDSPILYADDLDITPDGVIYFSDASTKFGAEAAGQTMKGSLLEIMEHGRTGRILAYNPATKQTVLIKDNLSFSNGVAMGPDGKSILVIETGEYRIHRIWVSGPKQDQSTIIIDNLPGFPDNINRALEPGTYYVGLISQRSKFLDDNSTKPGIRKFAWRLPAFMKPKAVDYGFIIHIDADGNILRTWQDPSGSYTQATGAHAPGDGFLYISSLNAYKLGRKKLP